VSDLEGAQDPSPAESASNQVQEPVAPNPTTETESVKGAAGLPISFRRIDRILIQGDSESGKSHLARKIIQGARRRVIITPHDDEWTEEPNRLIVRTEEQLLQGVKQCLSLGNLVAVLDDVDILITKTEKDPRMNELMMGARHRGVGWIIISRRTTDIPTLVFKQANKVFLFQTDLPQDLQIYRDYYNCDQTVKALNRVAHQCLFIDRETKKRQIVIAQP
jgi:hypothetical protein